MFVLLYEYFQCDKGAVCLVRNTGGLGGATKPAGRPEVPTRVVTLLNTRAIAFLNRTSPCPTRQRPTRPCATMSLSSEEEEEEQFLPSGGQSNLSDEEDPNDLSSSDISDDEPFKNNNPSSTSSQQPLPPPMQAQMLSFGPPYYGRPPTPLPPSPSLTSLLRPSRPTTPDASDDEGGLNSSAEPVPRASPKVPTYEYYGFVLYLFSSCCFLIYLLWSYLPSPFLHALGIHYYPDRWWSLATPAFLVVLLVYIYVALALYNTEYLTVPLHSLETIVDEAGKIAVVDGRGRIVMSEERRRNLERAEREREMRGAAAAAAAANGSAKGWGGGGGGGGGGGPGGGGMNNRHHHRKQSGNNGHHQHGFAREREVDWRACWNEGTDAVMDVPLAGVCEILYGGCKNEGGSE